MTDLPSLRFYCDESSHTVHRYAAVSGILIRPEHVEAVNNEITKLKESRGKQASSELKWSKVNRHDLPLYEDVVKYFKSLLDSNQVHFHVVICDMHAYDHRILNEGRKSTTVSKTYYQLLLHRCCRLYGDKAYVHVRPDAGECTQALPGLINGHNADAQRRFGLKLRPILSINLTHSNVNVMQMNDIVLGAIASHRNERDRKKGASPHKTHLAEVVRASLGVPHFGINTPWSGRLTVWNWKAREIERPRS